ncbi:hypothetical protein EJ08DRAFT_695940 [Tothia fuscella]|uniref:Fungal N-terminal domain-containing protein n=1 Tax=Tothia fuscella TaxID=1048955 RepID=A0A9P4U0P1_9PEZI|nr:hypothetical protein EJ08DRAFT_695940 [Tothia fuscella]
MDPASATVAFVGFAASVSTLAGLLLRSSKDVHDICQKVKHAPKELKELEGQQRLLHTISEELNLHELNGTQVSNQIRKAWEDILKTMTDDLHVFDNELKRMKSSIKTRAQGSRRLLLRAGLKLYFAPESIKSFNTRFSGHIGTLNLLLSQMDSSSHSSEITSP